MGKGPTKHWYVEHAFYENEEEKLEAKAYLRLWKKFFIKKFPPIMEYKEDEWIENEENKTISLKFCMVRKKPLKDKKEKKSIRKVDITKLSYKEVEYDVDGWVNAKDYTPSPFDLVIIKTANRTFNGWYTGEEWFSLKLSANDDILYWKRRKEVY